MVSLRQATMEDLFNIQLCNLHNLPENYRMNYYFYHLLCFPQITQMAEDENGKTVGYVLAKIDTENNEQHGHVTSVAIMRDYRMLGLASKLMKLSHRAMEDIHSAPYASLHVRVTNKAAYNLYSNVLGYSVKEIEHNYYADGEDAFSMCNYFNQENKTVNPNLVQNIVNSNTPPTNINLNREQNHINIEEGVEKVDHSESQTNSTDAKGSKKTRKKKKK